MFGGDADEDSLYGGALSGLPGFCRFLRKASQAKTSVLPPWWNEERAKECVKLGQKTGWSSLGCTVEKSDIKDHYGDPMMPMQLRMLAEMVYRQSASMF